MADNFIDPWQQELNIFSSPEITGIPSPDIVQNMLENLTTGTESRVPVSPLDEKLLGVFVARPLNSALVGLSTNTRFELLALWTLLYCAKSMVLPTLHIHGDSSGNVCSSPPLIIYINYCCRLPLGNMPLKC